MDMLNVWSEPMILLAIIGGGIVVGIVQGVVDIVRTPAIVTTNNNLVVEEVKLPNLDIENKLELIAMQIDTLHELSRSIDKQLDSYVNEKQRISLLNKKAVTIAKIEKLQDKQITLINKIDSL